MDRRLYSYNGLCATLCISFIEQFEMQSTHIKQPTKPAQTVFNWWDPLALLPQLLLLLALQLLMIAAPVHAAKHDFQYSKSNNHHLCAMTGIIDDTDFVMLKNNISKGCKSLLVNSQGGSVNAAIQMGRLLRKNQMDIQVWDGGRCASSCIFLYAGAVARLPYGPVEIHRIYLNNSTDSYEKTTSKYVEIERHVKRFLRDMNVKDTLYEDMMLISPENTKRLTLEELSAYGLGALDPIHSEFQANQRANRMGITKIEFLSRKAHASSICGSLDGYLDRIDYPCWDREFPGFIQREE